MCCVASYYWAHGGSVDVFLDGEYGFTLWGVDANIRFEFRRSHERCSVEKAVLRNFASFIGKHLCWGLVF